MRITMISSTIWWYGRYDMMIFHAMILRYKDCDAADDNLCDDTLKQRRVALDRANNVTKCDADDYYQDKEINFADDCENCPWDDFHANFKRKWWYVPLAAPSDTWQKEQLGQSHLLSELRQHKPEIHRNSLRLVGSSRRSPLLQGFWWWWCGQDNVWWWGCLYDDNQSCKWFVMTLAPRLCWFWLGKRGIIQVGFDRKTKGFGLSLMWENIKLVWIAWDLNLTNRRTDWLTLR